MGWEHSPFDLFSFLTKLVMSLSMKLPSTHALWHTVESDVQVHVLVSPQEENVKGDVLIKGVIT